MKTIQLTYDETTIPHGYELSGEFRPPRLGEHFTENGCSQKAALNFMSPRLIIRKKYTFLRDWWMPQAGYLYFSSTGCWFFSTEKPSHRTNGSREWWASEPGVLVFLAENYAKFNNAKFTPPIEVGCYKLGYDHK